MVDVIRSEYGYSDEYIMGKTMKWVRNSYDLCARRRYNSNLQLAQMVLHLYAAGMSKEVQPPKSFGEALLESRYKKKREKEKPKPKNDLPDIAKLSSLGIGSRKPRKSSEKDILSRHSSAGKAKQ